MHANYVFINNARTTQIRNFAFKGEHSIESIRIKQNNI